MTDRMNGVPAHQKDRSVTENDAAEGAAAPAPGGAESAGAGVSAPEGTASAPTDPPELASAAILQQWEYNNDGSLSGRVYGKKGFREGENMSTSIVPKDNRYGHYVMTTSGTLYRLGEKLVRHVEVKKPRRLIRDRVVEEAKIEGVEELWCGARFGKERGAAVLARQRMSGEGLPEAAPPAPIPAAAKPTDRLSVSVSVNQLEERSSPRDRKRPLAPPTPAEEAPKKKQPNQYTKLAQQTSVPLPSQKSPSHPSVSAPAPAPAGPSAVASAGPSPQGDKPRHPNQYTYRNAGERPKQPNQYSKQNAASQPSPKHGKHPNQYTYRQPNQHTVKLTSSSDRPKQPNQYTYAKKAAGEKLLAAKRHANQYTKSAERRAGGSGKTPDDKGAEAPPGFLGISRQAGKWVTYLKRNGQEETLGVFTSAKLAADVAMQAQQQLLAGSKLRLPADDCAASRQAGKRPAQAAVGKAAAPPGGALKFEAGSSSEAASASEDAALCPILSTKNASGFQGVSKASRPGHWEAVIQDAGKRRFLGCYPSAEEAAQAYAREFARLGHAVSDEGQLVNGVAHEAEAEGGGTSVPSEGAQQLALGCFGLEVPCWIQCEDCRKWRKLHGAGGGLRAELQQPARWVCGLNADVQRRSCDAPQESDESAGHRPRKRPSSSAEAAVGGEGREQSKGGRALRPLRPAKPPDDESPRDSARSRLADSKKRDLKDLPGGKLSKPSRMQQLKQQQQYLSRPSLGPLSTRLAVFEDGVWRFQPALGNLYQVQLDREPTCPLPEQCRKRTETLMWCPAKADVEGLDVQAYLSAAAKLYSAARPPHECSTEVALQLLLSHDYDVLAATHSMATAIGVDKLLEPEAPVCAATSLVRGRSGARVGLHLTLRHLATSVCEGQPQGFVRSTRSRTVHLDTQPEPCVWSAEEEAVFLLGMRREYKNIRNVHAKFLPQKTLAQVVEFYWSLRGQLIKLAVNREREVAAAAKAAAEAAAAAAAGDASDSPKRRRKVLFGARGDDGVPGKPGPKLGQKRPRSSGVVDGKSGAKLQKRFGPRVLASVTVRGANAEVRLRLRVKRVDQGSRAEKLEKAPRAAAARAEARPPVSAQLRLTHEGKIKLMLQVQRTRLTRLKRKPEAQLEDDDDDDDEAEEEGNEAVCTWLECERCKKWRIVPEHHAAGVSERWYCEMNIDAGHNRCDVPQEPDDATGDQFAHLPVPSNRALAAKGKAAAAAASAAGAKRRPSGGGGGADAPGAAQTAKKPSKGPRRRHDALHPLIGQTFPSMAAHAAHAAHGGDMADMNAHLGAKHASAHGHAGVIVAPLLACVVVPANAAMPGHYVIGPVEQHQMLVTAAPMPLVKPMKKRKLRLDHPAAMPMSHEPMPMAQHRVHVPITHPGYAHPGHPPPHLVQHAGTGPAAGAHLQPPQPPTQLQPQQPQPQPQPQQQQQQQQHAGAAPPALYGRPEAAPAGSDASQCFVPWQQMPQPQPQLAPNGRPAPMQVSMPMQFAPPPALAAPPAPPSASAAAAGAAPALASSATPVARTAPLPAATQPPARTCAGAVTHAASSSGTGD